MPPLWFHDRRRAAHAFAAGAGATLPELMARLACASPADAMIYLRGAPTRPCTDHALSATMTGTYTPQDGRGFDFANR